MPNRILITSICGLIAAAAAARADKNIDCAKQSLAGTLEKENKPQVITFTGVCQGPIVIQTDAVTLKGVGSAAIDGGGQDALTLDGAQRTALSGFEVRNGRNGIAVINGANATLTGVASRNHARNGILLTGGAGAALSGVTVTGNGLNGLSVETGSAATVNGSFTGTGNRVFGINVNGSALTFSRANVTVTGNAIGIQVAVEANAFIEESSSVINASNNQAVGLTVVSGAQMVAFGGTINANGNGVNGVSINSTAGLDLDAGAVLNVSNNAGNGLAIQQHSTMTVFNTPQFSGVPGFSTVNATGNGLNGVSVLTGSVLTLSGQGRIVSTGNQGIGINGDNGAAVRLVNSTSTGNTIRDLNLTFGARADLPGLTFGSYACDATVLVRGPGAICPH